MKSDPLSLGPVRKPICEETPAGVHPMSFDLFWLKLKLTDLFLLTEGLALKFIPSILKF